ncbi:AfsR/SARP family transcriptional regulator [Kutzneria sp. CA-103260]|uniref:AfsR/SARP family transcriptional regulator n=1 Tax=Kutzneria sp. CA-103260 TaxID=2802641 RepID=UPI001BABB557|nr:BTAD domain-containing putative transcriptional regulator [Kutzneria sp. CA-103260]
MLTFTVLGPVTAARDGDPVELGPPQQRAVLALLLAKAGKPAGQSELIDLVWGERAPTSAANLVHRYVGALRRALEPGLTTRRQGELLTRQAGGYELLVDPDACDLSRFRALVARANMSAGLDDYVAALELVRGRCAAEVGRSHPVFAEVDHEIADAARAAADRALALGRPEVVLAGVRRVAGWMPLDEALHVRLMRLLVALGQPGAAEDVYRDIAQRLVDQLGIDPGKELRAALRMADVRAAVLRPAQLPADVRSFAGRDDELAAMDRWADESVEVLCLEGMPGAGKSTLAVRWAQRSRHRFRDGQLYVNLHHTGPDSAVPMLRSFLRALGLPADQVPESLDELVAEYRRMTAGKELLVVVDGACRVEQVRGLAAPGALVVVTCKRRLPGLSEVGKVGVVSVGMLDPGQSRELLTRRLGAARIDAEPVAAERIVQACGGLPLALSLVAARLLMNPGFTLASVVDDLTTVFGGSGLRTVFSWSYERLGADAARLFRLLGLHPLDGFSAPVTARLLDVDPPTAEAALAELVDSWLVDQPRPGRYRAHGLVMAYAHDLSQEIDSDAARTAARTRMVEHYVQGAQWAHDSLAAARNEREAVAWYTAEYEVVETLIRQVDEPWRLTIPMQRFYLRRGLLQDWEDSVRLSLARAVDPGPRARLLMGLAGVSQCTGRFDEAVTLYRESLIVGKEVDDPKRVIITLIGLAGVEESRGDRKTAGIVLTEAWQILETRLGVEGGPLPDDTKILLRYLLDAGADLGLFEAEVVRARLASALE